MFCASLAIPSLSSKDTDVTQQATIGKTRRTQTAFTAKKTKLPDTLLPLGKKKKSKRKFNCKFFLKSHLFFVCLNGFGSLSSMAFMSNSLNRSQGVATAEQLAGYATAEGPGARLQNKLTERH